MYPRYRNRLTRPTASRSVIHRSTPALVTNRLLRAINCKLASCSGNDSTGTVTVKEKPSELDKVYGRLKTKWTDETVYYAHAGI